MCIGIPMQVAETCGAYAWCEGRGMRLQLDMALVGEQPVGAWILAFRGWAQRVMSEEEALRNSAALDALEAVERGEGDLDAYFHDLVQREPQLPEHLRPKPADAVNAGNERNNS